MLETERFILRPWRDADAATLFRWASDPRVGPPANWAPYVSIEHARETLHAVYCAPDTFAICAKHPEEFDAAAISRIEGEADFGDMTRGLSGRAFLRERKKVASAPLNPIGSIRFVKPDHANCAIGDNDREMGIWLAAPFGASGSLPKWRARCCATDSASAGFPQSGSATSWKMRHLPARRTSSASSLCASRRRPILSRAWYARSKSRCSRKARGKTCRRQPSKSAHSQAALFFGATQRIKGSPIA